MFRRYRAERSGQEERNGFSCEKSADIFQHHRTNSSGCPTPALWSSAWNLDACATGEKKDQSLLSTVVQ